MTINAHWISQLQATLDALQEPVQVYLYGSRVRGEARADSDWDLLIIARDDWELNARESLLSAIYQVGIENNMMLSCAVFTQSEWEHLKRLRTPYAVAVSQEAVLLWTSERLLSTTA